MANKTETEQSDRRHIYQVKTKRHVINKNP